MLKRLPLFGIGLLLVIVLIGCKTETISNGDTTAIPQDNNTTSPQGTEQLIGLAKSDLAQRLKIAQSDIKLVSVEEVLFSDTSLGVPEPDTFYAEVITPGYILVLDANGHIYQYNTDKTDKVVLYQEDFIMPGDTEGMHDRTPWIPVD